MHFGKVIGLLCGLFVFSNPFSLIVCLSIGVAADYLFQKLYEPQRQMGMMMQDFSLHYISLHAKLAKADGVVRPQEIECFRDCSVVLDADEDAVGFVYNHARRTAKGFEKHAQFIADLTKDQAEARERVWESLFYVFHHAGGGEEQKTVLRAVANILQLSKDSVLACKARVSQDSRRHQTKQEKASVVTSYYKVLGVKSSASKDEIKKAYRKLIREHHPDKLRGAGKSEAQIKRAEDKLAKIAEAYKAILDSL